MAKIELQEKAMGITERDIHSKALLNTDMDALLRYRIQRHKSVKYKENTAELQRVKGELNDLKTELCEIRELLKKITNRE